MTIGIIVGSLRRDSYNRKLAQTVCENIPRETQVKFINIHLPLYNQDFEDEHRAPPSWLHFREEIAGCDAFLFFTPEHNRGLPAVLKNALDIGSRPQTQNVWAKKSCAVVSATPGKLGGFGAGQSFRQSAAFLDLRVMTQPEMYLGSLPDLLDNRGDWNVPTKAFLSTFTAQFLTFCEANRIGQLTAGR